MSAANLWTAVKADYDSAGLVTLTNIRDRSATTINDSVGTAAAQSVIDLWPIYAQVPYDAANATHVEVAEFGVIAVLWRRGGSSSTIEQVKWDEVFGGEGMISRVRRTGPRGHARPVSNSGVQQAPETGPDGGQVRGWADRESLPVGFLSTRTDAS
ncbi:MAG: hypothetical protein RLZZ246_1085, partial [Planctomycetota bacterium]